MNRNIEFPVKTTCPYCGVGCGVLASVDEEGVVSVKGDPDHPANEGRLCSKGTALGETIYLHDRLLYPEIQGEQVSWEQALSTVAGRFSEVIDEYGADAVAFYVSGQLLTEDYYVANKLMKGFIGSANIDTNSRLCMSSAVAAYKRAFGEDCVPCTYEDLDKAELIVLTGSNAAWCHPVLFQRIVRAKKANPNLKVVNIDPRETQTSSAADLQLSLKPGSDATLFNGLLNYLSENDAENSLFTQNCTTGMDEALLAAKASAGSVEEYQRGCEANSMNTGPYCKARQRLSLSHIKEGMLKVGQVLHQQAPTSWLWKGHRVVLLDGTTLLMPDTNDNQASYPQQGVQKPGLGFPIMRLVGLLSLATGSCMGYATGPFQGKGNGETSLFSHLIGTLGKSDLLLADRYYTTYAIMTLLIEQGTPLVFRQRHNVKTDFRRGRWLGSKDHRIDYKKPPRKPVWMSTQAYAQLPSEITLREFAVNGIASLPLFLILKSIPRQG